MTSLNVGLSIIDSSTELSEIDKVKAAVLLTGYDQMWSEFDWQVIDTEREVTFEIPQTAWSYSGKVDTLVTGYGEQLVMVEHKTTTQDLSDKTAVYFSKLSFDEQIGRYHLAQWLMGEPLSQTIYDCLRKITIRPKRVTLEQKDVLLAEGTYLGQPLEAAALIPPEEIEALGVETPELYEIRCRQAVLGDLDKHYARCGNIHRSTEQMVDTLGVLQQIAIDIDNAMAYNHWYQNTQSCKAFNSPCEFLPLCMGISDPASDKWEKRTGGNRDPRTLSHSRAGCFQLCRRKYYWRYVEGIQKVGRASDALTFGSVIHEALEAWWLTQTKESCNVNSNTAGVTATGDRPVKNGQDDGPPAA